MRGRAGESTVREGASEVRLSQLCDPNTRTDAEPLRGSFLFRAQSDIAGRQEGRNQYVGSRWLAIGTWFRNNMLEC